MADDSPVFGRKFLVVWRAEFLATLKIGIPCVKDFSRIWWKVPRSHGTRQRPLARPETLLISQAKIARG
jgi:hypothetical protein